MAKYHITIPDDLLRAAQAAGVKVPGACREGLAARTYGRGVLVPIGWYEMALAAVGGEGPGVDPPLVWPVDGLSTPIRLISSDRDQLERLDQLSERLAGAEGKLRAVVTYAAIATGLLVVGGVVVYASTR